MNDRSRFYELGKQAAQNDWESKKGHRRDAAGEFGRGYRDRWNELESQVEKEWYGRQNKIGNVGI